jgi:DNA-binding response OmpR family regulator
VWQGAQAKLDTPTPRSAQSVLLEKSHVPKTLLAVDDSATMRKVLEITFGGEDFRVVSADGAAGALAKMGEEPVAVVIDTSLGGDDGYALAKEVRSRSARAAILLMTSRYNPFDANRARDAGIDDSVDKPFDTQALIDKVKKAMLARETARVAAPAPPPAPVAPPPQPMNVTAPLGGAPRPPAPLPQSAPQSAPSTVTGPKGWPTQRTHTLSFEGGPTAAPPPAISVPTPLARTAQSGPVAPPPAAITAPAPPPPPPPAPFAQAAHPTAAPTGMPTTAPRAMERAPVTAVASTNGHLAGKLDELGLSPQQVEAVLALSRELVERVVWEVVPALAETLIKEEIVRLTKDG